MVIEVMDWLGVLTLIKKIPTLKGIADFFYVATHWGSISSVFEEYRRQIKDREDWLKTQEQTLKKIFELQKQQVIGEYEDKLKNAGVVLRDLVNSYSSALATLTVHYRFHPLEWELVRHSLDPKVREAIESQLKSLPPPPPPPLTLQEFLTGSLSPLGTVQRVVKGVANKKPSVSDK